MFPVRRVLPEGLALPEEGTELPVPGSVSVCPASRQGGRDAGTQQVRAAPGREGAQDKPFCLEGCEMD